jgi:hypothetical protein
MILSTADGCDAAEYRTSPIVRSSANMRKKIGQVLLADATVACHPRSRLRERHVI